MPRPRKFKRRTYTAKPARDFAAGAWDAWTGIRALSPRSQDYWDGNEFGLQRIANSGFTEQQFDAALAGAIRGDVIERCRWCAAPVHDDRAIYQWKGRVVATPICADCERKKLADWNGDQGVML